MDIFPLYITVKVSLIATAFTITVGLALAWVMAKRSFLGKGLLDAVIMQPLVIPPTVLGYYLLTVFGRSGWLGGFLENTLGIEVVFTWKGAVVAAFISSLPLFVKPARAALEGVGEELENAARLLGKTELQVIRTVTLPLAWRGILAGAVMAFARATGEFGATLMIAGNIPGLTQTLPIAIYDAVQSGDDYTANVLVGIITLFSFSVLYFAGRFSRLRL
ncbi:MAG TPA: molybdate ABC transporter permease subunit [Deltaproteobacteria bacterium]|nr:MAG: molybdenum ABC transporter permease subunit [Deltaproteobacteria bacterium GWA2_55_82]OGQ64065.1 MAG: molybdenum ABC transporter permease subunit [Deltaproteobacteria bacterium RIFCSPLOWO2_02_FULL_55_12]OIJ74515.1 MAG: molybdenum ABC transporter permease subunit [Deltaproteobacteria bacterium GWC2_55_46]HBG47178.1 molybdate ABC transporter permease subunit [Deltaproteobacteria bacterium]HCY10760.1 molybdate ABC transporter permease subunit [Deltaproteobacteria bacterium]